MTVGVAIVQISGSGDKHAENKDDENSANHNRLVGLVVVVLGKIKMMMKGFSKLNLSSWYRIRIQRKFLN